MANLGVWNGMQILLAVDGNERRNGTDNVEIMIAISWSL